MIAVIMHLFFFFSHVTCCKFDIYLLVMPIDFFALLDSPLDSLIHYVHTFIGLIRLR
jgi:hypothetical protein